MKIVLTGASGFLGKAILEAGIGELVSIGRSLDNHIKWDLKGNVDNFPVCDMVVHAAGKAHMIPKNESEVKSFFDINVLGTENLLRSLDTVPPSCFVFISSVAVYGVEEGEMIKEDHPLEGKTPYALSKIQAEELVKIWGHNRGVNVVILRLPLITGKNPPGNLAALYKAIKKSYYFRIGSGQAQKSMVGAADIAALLPTLLDKNGIYHLTDGRHPRINEVDRLIASLQGKSVRSIPATFMRLLAKVGDYVPGFPLNTQRLNKLNATLTFDDTKARKELDWNPNPALQYLAFD
jgi:nucleoside-diphosphate-sugar epimerase